MSTTTDGTPNDSRVLELRVHGVHATPPQSMLGASEVRQVAGDGITGIYRSSTGEIPLRSLPKNAAVEAYSWGGLTSGVSGFLGPIRRAAWLFLLPFALVNLSYWARPEMKDAQVPPSDEGGAPKTPRFSAGLLRMAGMLLTALMVLTPLTIGVDLFAWQCYRDATAGCPTIPSMFDFMQTNAPRRIAIGSLPALLVVMALWGLSRQSLERYEAVQELSAEANNNHRLVLRHPKLWAGGPRTRRLQRLHVAFALCVIVAYTGIPVLLGQGLRNLNDHPSFMGLAIVDGAAVIFAIAALFQVCLAHGGDIEYPPGKTAPQRESSYLPTVAGLALAAHLAILFFGPFSDPFPDLTALPGENVWILALLIAFAAIGVMLFLVGRAHPIFVGVGGLAVLMLAPVSSIYLAPDSRGFPGWPNDWPDLWVSWLPFIGIPLAVAGWLVMFFWQRQQPGDSEDDDKAWGGASAAVLLGCAVWIALLFTTSVVTSLANYLNGPDQSVADLGTEFPGALRPTSDAPKYTVQGSVVVHRGDLLVTPTAVSVRSGVVTVGSYHRPISVDPDAVSLASRRLTGAELQLPPDSNRVVTYDDSCIHRIDPSVTNGEPPVRCSFQRGDLPVDGVLPPLPAGVSVLVGDPSHPVAIRPSQEPQTPLTIPQVLVWAPISQLLWAVMAIVVTLACWIRLRRLLLRRITLAVETDPAISEQDRQLCIRARMRAAFPHRAERLVGLFGVGTSVLFLALMGFSLTGQAPWELLDDGGSSVVASLATAALWIAVGTSAGLLWLASKMRKSESTRKTVGILWDLTTFWPRAIHPFAPPCYAERVVPELLNRIRWATTTTGPAKWWGGASMVVLSGHSQGSTLVLAAASRLSDPELRKVRVITYGSQIRTWYGRVFPAVFGPRAIGYVPTQGRYGFGCPFPDVPEDPHASPAREPDGNCSSRTAEVAEVPPPPGPEVVVADTSGSTEYLPELATHLCHPDFAASLLRRLHESGEAPYWVSLFRRSDPIGFRVFSDQYQHYPDKYVPEVPEASKGDLGARLMTHGGYQHSPEYGKEVSRWTGEILVGPSEPPMKNPPPLPPL